MGAIVSGSVDVFLAACKELKPTPVKSHYLFNLRDLARVIQGVQMLSKERATDGKKVIKLWVHECCRVIYDRLTTEEDQDWFFMRLFKSSRDKNKEDLA